MPNTRFEPAKHGFAFRNDFVNNILTLPDGTAMTTRGRCGGMAFAALDYYFAGLPVPKNNALPPDGTLLADYIYKRLGDSFSLSGPKFVTLSLAPDHPTWFSAGLTKWTKGDEFANIRNTVDGGNPAVLGLIKATDMGAIGDNHQVVVYGYDSDPDRLPVWIYDNNSPGDAVGLSTDPASPHFSASNGSEWRGFFVEWYRPTVPDYLAEGALLKEASDPRVYLIFGGAKFWIPSEHAFAALGLSWPSVRVVQDGSLAYIADIPGDGTLLKELSSDPVYVVINGLRHWITSPGDFDAHGFSWDKLRVIPDGALIAIPDGGPLAPAPPQQPVGWGAADSGDLRDQDTDLIRFQVDHGAIGPDAVEFVLNSDGEKWKKWLILDDGGGGRWTIETDGPKTQDQNGLYLYQLPNGKLEFWKAKLLGQMTKVLELPIAFLQGGDRVTFHWEQD